MKSNPPDMADVLQRADKGDRRALKEAYGMAAAWLAQGKAPPPPLAEWIGGRLMELSTLMRDTQSKDDERRIRADALRAMRLQRAGKAGRPPKRATAIQNRSLAAQVRQHVDWGMVRADAIRRVAEDNYASVKTVEAACTAAGN